MKKIKIFRLIILLTLLFPIFTSNVFAASATVGFSGNSTVAVGNTITINMYVSNVKDAVGGIVSVGGNVSFNSEYLEYVSSTGVSSPYQFQINTAANYKIAGLDTTLSNGINSQTTVFTFVFKAKKAGTTQITLTNAILSDTANKISATVVPKTITITAEVPKSSDATLKSLGVEGFTLSPAFSANKTSYELTVPSNTNTVKIIGSANDSKAKVTGLGSVTLTGNSTTASVKVTAEDGTTKTYTIKINKQTPVTPDEPSTPTQPVVKDSDATLKSLNINGYNLTPVFNKNTKTYSINVGNDITGLGVEAIANSSKANVTITGNNNWKVGNNTISIKVTAENGTTNIYTVNVTRAASTNPDDPSVPGDTGDTGEPGDTGGTGGSTGTGGTSTPTKLSSDNYLANLIINSSHEMAQSFNRNVSNYNITVPYDVTSLNLKTTLSSSKARVTITGNSNFQVGDNLVEIRVTAEDGSSRIYTLNVTRTNEQSKNDLSDIIISGTSLSPKFDPNTLEYSVKVDSDVDELDIIATSKDPNSKVEIIGNENLKEGKNTVLIKVTDENGFTKYYQIEVEKEAESGTILGLTPLVFGIMTAIAGLLLAFSIFLLLRLKPKEPTPAPTPIIEVKPEFNFSSKNTSDDDVVHGDFKQANEITENASKNDTPYIEAEYKEIPYNMYDDVVTKEELIDALKEAKETKDSSKLNMLLQQEALNKKKKELQEKFASEEGTNNETIS